MIVSKNYKILFIVTTVVSILSWLYFYQHETLRLARKSRSKNLAFTFEKLISSDVLTSGSYKPGPINPWVIVVYATLTYAPVTELWYTQLTELGYMEHRIYALDPYVYDYFSNRTDIFGNDFRIFLPEHDPSDLLSDHDLKIGKQNKNNGQYFKHIWSIRIQNVNALIQQGYNVMMSDAELCDDQKIKKNNSQTTVKLVIFSDQEVHRGKLATGIDCKHNEWIISPQSGKHGGRKLKDFEHFSHCFQPQTKELIHQMYRSRREQWTKVRRKRRKIQ